MGFMIVQSEPFPVRRWVRVDQTDTLYVGQIVKSTGSGFGPIGAASGAADTTTKSMVFGVVIGTNNEKPVFNSTYKGDSITGVTSQADQVARSPRGQAGGGGMHPAGDYSALVEIEIITPSTRLMGPIFNAAYGTGITTTTVTTGSTTGAGYTAGACDFTPVASLCTSYCASGANKGLYFVSSDTSTTVRTFATYWTNDIAIGDTFRSVPLRVGMSYGQLDAESTYIEASATPATDYYALFVENLDLSVAGSEYAIFRFSSVHFDPARA